jgi:hypothetical protein
MDMEEARRALDAYPLLMLQAARQHGKTPEEAAKDGKIYIEGAH